MEAKLFTELLEAELLEAELIARLFAEQSEAEH